MNAAALGFLTLAALLFLCLLIILGDAAMRGYMGWREKRDMLIRDQELKRFCIIAFDSPKRRAKL